MTEQHRTEVETRGRLMKTYVATCSCGWLGEERVYRKEAEDDGTDHEVVVVSQNYSS